MPGIDVEPRASQASEGRAAAPLSAVDASIAAALLAVAAVLGKRVSGLGFLGWDAYPILAASRPGPPGWLLDVLGGPLAGDLLPMSFHRPALSLSVALEWPIWGLSAGGYLAMNAALFGLCGFVLQRLVLCLGIGRAGALAAGLFFALHPAVADVVPYLPRRPELLCTLFVLLALTLDHGGRFGRSRTRIAGAWLATAAAVAAKETAVAVPILIACARWLSPAAGSGALRQAVRGFAAHGTVLGVALLLRLRTLGGLGGYPESDVSGLPEGLRTVAKTLIGVVMPMRAEQWPPWVAVATLALGVASMAVGRGGLVARHRLRPATFAGVWVLAFAAVYGAGARLAPWYLLIVAAGAAIGFGLVSEVAVTALRAGGARPTAAAVTLLGGGLLLATFAVDSPLVRPLPEFHQATRDADDFLEALEEKIRRTPAGGRVEAGRYPRLVIGAGGRQVPVLVPRSLPGWARIAFPDREIEFVAGAESAAESSSPGVTVVVLGGGDHRNMAPE